MWFNSDRIEIDTRSVCLGENKMRRKILFILEMYVHSAENKDLDTLSLGLNKLEIKDENNYDGEGQLLLLIQKLVNAESEKRAYIKRVAK